MRRFSFSVSNMTLVRCKIRTATDIRIGCCEREQTLNAGVSAAVASTASHHRPLLHRRRRQSNMEKTHAATAFRKRNRWLGAKRAARSQPLARDDLMERQFGCDGVANSQVVLAVANRRSGLITGGASWPGCQTSMMPPISCDYPASPEPLPERRMQAEPATGPRPERSLPVPSSSRTAGSSPSDASLRRAWHLDNLTQNPTSAAGHAVDEGQPLENAPTL